MSPTGPTKVVQWISCAEAGALATIDASPEKSEYLVSVLKDLSENLRAQNKNIEAGKLDARRKDLEAAAAKAKAAAVPEKQ